MPDEQKLTNGDWDSCKMYVLQELKRMNNLIERGNDKLDAIKENQTVLKVKVMMYGIIAGFVITVLTNLYFQGWFNKK